MRDHNSRRRKRNYYSSVRNLAYAMITGDVKNASSHFEDLVRYGGKMSRRDCEEFMREFRCEMEDQVPSKRQLAVNKEKRKQRNLGK
tara:strand:- start:197 stop:457 length:261 start_codon:yes stop_codon:yes gene_type:complete